MRKNWCSTVIEPKFCTLHWVTSSGKAQDWRDGNILRCGLPESPSSEKFRLRPELRFSMHVWTPFSYIKTFKLFSWKRPSTYRYFSPTRCVWRSSTISSIPSQSRGRKRLKRCQWLHRSFGLHLQSRWLRWSLRSSIFEEIEKIQW